MSANGRKRIAIEKLNEVVNEMLCDSDCSELSWNEDSNDEIIYNDNVTVRATDGSDSETEKSDSEISAVGPNADKCRKITHQCNSSASTSNCGSNDVIATTECQWTPIENNPTIWKCTESSEVSGIVMQNIGDEMSVYDVFHQFIGNDFWEMISRETNKYAQQCFGNPSYKRIDSG
jgi:hypothetical protein